MTLNDWKNALSSVLGTWIETIEPKGQPAREIVRRHVTDPTHPVRGQSPLGPVPTLLDAVPEGAQADKPHHLSVPASQAAAAMHAQARAAVENARRRHAAAIVPGVPVTRDGVTVFVVTHVIGALPA